MKFSAVILAGGKSSRMGCDKALLQLDGQSLLARQIGLVRSIGASEVFISSRKDADYPASGCCVLQDRYDDAGPLAGIERALDAASLPLLLVLAVDMPGMSADLLLRVASGCVDGVGAIPRVGGSIEPLAAFFPKSAEKLIAEMFTESRQTGQMPRVPGARRFAERCVQENLAAFVDLHTSDGLLFSNWNTPADILGPCRN